METVGLRGGLSGYSGIPTQEVTMIANDQIAIDHRAQTAKIIAVWARSRLRPLPPLRPPRNNEPWRPPNGQIGPRGYPRVRRKVQPSITIDQALLNENLLGSAIGNPASWSRWLAVLKAAFALKMNERERKLFAEVSGDRAVPPQRVRELCCTVGRRSGKSRIPGAIAVYAACFVPHRLAKGERGWSWSWLLAGLWLGWSLSIASVS